ncbi:TPA: hypothetical protein ACF5B0_002146 [Vibrio parahaemolyticus]|uniref:hypothetical protein n=1 Tax=Vibrio parahaemolyticus TaxID=670 RepID=UPI00111FC770|nr:hypothetical protein [Vibrio parahaemolyticus]EGR0905747.1 hypothetical protein [Vibrio parahaemolyticus]EJG1536660.1 hypothetical protein [Vibrio parahaemolyticus]EJY0701164.1 hypothetical protein [Vibrio parahaemolyticus]ELA9430822.1 hypothetical protein [Vibrio parahaemolyticus]MBE4039740.1 hypothetical protein [Vibrio parahaemolyticus]
MTQCQSPHRYYPEFESLPDDQGDFSNGRHKCAGCAYEYGRQLGLDKTTSLTIDFNALPDSQAGTVRHKSARAAFAIGYRDGVAESYVNS